MYENWFYILVFPMGYYATLFPDEGTMYANYTVYQGTKSIGLLLPSTLLCCSTNKYLYNV